MAELRPYPFSALVRRMFRELDERNSIFDLPATKFFGGDDNKFVWASGNRLDPGGHRNKRVAVYNFKPGVYTLVLSGRSKLFKVDRIFLRHEAIAKEKAEAVK